MAEYIEREALLLQIDLHGTNKFGMLDENIREFIKKQPTADVVEVKHGEWEEVKYIEGCLNSYKHTCSYCGKSYFDNNSNNYPFCPLCGAKMDGVSNG